MASDDYYDILSVKRTASHDEIRRAHRTLAKKYHPDRNIGDDSAEAKFKLVQEAYEVLKDDKKRAQYDQFGKVGVGHFSETGDQRVYRWGDGAAINVDELQDLFTAFGGRRGGGGGRASIFDQFFGNKRRVSAATPRQQVATPVAGKDIERKVKLSFEQGIHGATIDIKLTTAGGKREAIEVKIPPGVRDGQRIRVKGKGRAGRNGGPPGNLNIICEIQDHPYFQRRDGDIHLDVPVTVTEAMLGANIDVPTLQGNVTVTIPPGTSSGTKLRLKGKGPAGINGRAAGDQIIVVAIVVPKILDHDQRKTVEELADGLELSPREELGWN